MKLSILALFGGCLTITACQSPDRPFVDATTSGAGGTSSTSGTSSTGGAGGGQGAAIGTPCGNDAECAKGVCADGVCCDRVCEGQCEACDVGGIEGTCSLVTGTPHPPRATCGGGGLCAGTCDGSSTACTFPSMQTICGAACDGTCDGAGKCSGGSGVCPGGFGCGASGCLTSCSGPADCQPNFVCNGTACERVPESDCLDGIDNNGDGLADCEDPTCNNVTVECVPAAPAGGELGVQSATGMCPTDYPMAEVFHTGLQPGACSGCTCQTQCSATVRLYTGLSCDTTAHQEVFAGPPTGSSSDVVCKNYPTVSYKSVTMTNPLPSGCVAAGTATQAPPTWATNDTFCAANSSPTCGDATKVCVAKRATDPLCVRVDGAASCPAAYTSGASGVYFTDFTPGSCGSCSSCTASVGNICKATLLTPQVHDTANCGGASNLVDTNCNTLNRPSYSSARMGFAKNGIDGCVSNVTSTPPQPSGGVRICCQ